MLAIATALCVTAAGHRPLEAQERGPAAEYDSPPARLAVTAHAGASLQDNLGRFRVGRDVVTYGLRLTVDRQGGVHPWVDVGRFTRPGLECLATLPCARSGSLARAGLTLPLSANHREPGLHGAAHGGVGAAFADETSFSYVIGFAIDWRQMPRLSPMVGIRWEHIGGINFAMLSGGLRFDL